MLSYSVRVRTSQVAARLQQLPLLRATPSPSTLSRSGSAIRDMAPLFTEVWWERARLRVCLRHLRPNVRLALLAVFLGIVGAARVVEPRRISIDLWYSSAMISPQANRSLRISSAEPARSPRREGKILIIDALEEAKKPEVGSIGERNGPRQCSSRGAVVEGLANLVK